MKAINLDQTADKGLECQQENELNWPSFYDGTSMKIHDGYGIFAIPTILVIDHEGKIRKNPMDRASIQRRLGGQADRAGGVSTKQADSEFPNRLVFTL